MLPLFLSRLLILYQLLGRVLTAPTHYLQKKKNKKKSLLRFVTMKGNLVVCVRWKLPPGQAHGAAATARGWDRLVPNVPNYAVNVWLCDPALSFSKLGPTSGTSRPRCAFMQPPPAARGSPTAPPGSQPFPPLAARGRGRCCPAPAGAPSR